jgi:hypothetical protein
MSSINLRRVLLGGLAAGVFVNISQIVLNTMVLSRESEAAMRALNLPVIGGQAIAYFTAWGFLQSFIAIWLYAALRDTLGPGARSALILGVLIWMLSFLLPRLGGYVLGMYPLWLTLKSAAWTLIETPLSVLLGAWLYRVEEIP